MTEWGHFSVIQVFIAVITAVRTMIRITALSPPVLSTVDGGRLSVRVSVFSFFWSLIHCIAQDPGKCGEEGFGGLDALFLTNMLAAAHGAKRSACSEQTQCELALGWCDLAHLKETDRGPATGDCVFANIWCVCMYSYATKKYMRLRWEHVHQLFSLPRTCDPPPSPVNTGYLEQRAIGLKAASVYSV